MPKKTTVYTLVSIADRDGEATLKTETFRDMDNLKERLKDISPTDPNYELYEGEAVPFGVETAVTVGAPRKRKAATTSEPKRKGGRPPGSKNRPKPVVVVEDEVMA